MNKQKNKIYILFIILLLIIPFQNVFAKTVINPFTGLEKEFSMPQDGVEMTTTKKTKQLLKGASSFNCNTGEIDLNISIADDVASFLENYGKNTVDAYKSIVKEMSMQKSLELMLDLVALIHYKVTQEGISALSVFKGLEVAQLAGCMSSAVMDAIEIDLDAGLGMNVYDIFTGKAGINLAGVLSVYECIENVFGFPKDKAGKEKFAESQRWVRHLFYKLLNESFEMLFSMQVSAGKLSTECKEIDKKLKEENLEITLGQLGCVVTPSGTEICNYVDVAKPVPVTTKIVNEAKTDAKTMSDKKTEIDQSKKAIEKQTADVKETTSYKNATRDQKSTTLKAQAAKKALADPYIYEANIATKSTQNVNYDIIDKTDMSSEEIRLFNGNIYDTMQKDLVEGNQYKTYRKQEAFLNVLKKVFSITTTSSYALDSKIKILNAKKKDASGNNVYMYDETTSNKKLLETEYYAQLYEKVLYFNGLKNAILTKEEKNRIEKNLRKELPKKIVDSSNKDLFNNLLKIKQNNVRLEKLKKWNFQKEVVAGGFPLFSSNLETFKSVDNNTAPLPVPPTNNEPTALDESDVGNLPLLKLLRKREASGSYTAYNAGSKGVKNGGLVYSGLNYPVNSLTSMTIKQIKDTLITSSPTVSHSRCNAQRSPAPSGGYFTTGCDKERLFAVGGYQIIPKTMITLLNYNIGISNNTVFTKANQDIIAFKGLIQKKRPMIYKYIMGITNGDSARNSAMNSLGNEWCSFTKSNKQPASHCINTANYTAAQVVKHKAKFEAKYYEQLEALERTREILSGKASELNLNIDTSVEPQLSDISITDEKDIIKMVKNQYIEDLNSIRGKSTALPYADLPKINELVAIRKPLHELEYLKIFYQLESPEQVLSMLSKANGEIIYKAQEDASYNIFDKNFQRNSYFLSAQARNNYNYPVETINYIIRQMKLLKQMYAVELIDLYSKRITAINRWAMSSYQNASVKNNESLKQFKETEVEKIKLKMLQKRILIKMFLEKEVK